MKRRSFIKQGLSSMALPSLLGGLSFEAFGSISEAEMVSDKVMVIVQLNGGNDGLNTVVPLDLFENYQSARPNIYIPQNRLLKIEQNETVGLHPKMKDLHELFLDGKAGLIQGVGYPNPNFSHFRSRDIWHSSVDSDEYATNGWLGRYLGASNPGYPVGYPTNDEPDPLAIQIGNQVNTSLQGPVYSMGMAVQNPSNTIDLSTHISGNYGNSYAGDHLAFINQTAKQTNQYSARIAGAAEKANNSIEYPDNQLANQLKIVAQLIAGGLKTKIYYVNFGGFDTHANQINLADTTTGLHANLLETVSTSIGAFMKDITTLGQSERVIGFTYSEFGRRIKANGSNGTDHGTSAPMFTFGEKINSRVFGESPDIPMNPGTRDNLPMQYDFRSVYASLLGGWFCADTSTLNEVLLKDFQQLPLIQSNVCQTITSLPEEEEDVVLTNYPNPFSDNTRIEFISDGGHVLLQVFDMRGRLQSVPLDKVVPTGKHHIQLSTSKWAMGSYFLRFQNGIVQKVRRLSKV